MYIDNVPVTSSSRTERIAELWREVDSVRCMVRRLDIHVEHLKQFQREVAAMNKSLKSLAKVNSDSSKLLNKE